MDMCMPISRFKFLLLNQAMLMMLCKNWNNQTAATYIYQFTGMLLTNLLSTIYKMCIFGLVFLYLFNNLIFSDHLTSV